MGGDVDSYAGPFLSLAYLGHRDYLGGDKLPLPMVPPVQHSGAQTRSERVAPRHRPVIQGGGEEAPTDGGRGDAGG